MGIGVSLILIAVGAILTWAVNTEVSGVDIQTVGVILMIVGLAGALLSLVFWSSWAARQVTAAGVAPRTSRTARTSRSAAAPLPCVTDEGGRTAAFALRPWPETDPDMAVPPTASVRP